MNNTHTKQIPAQDPEQGIPPPKKHTQINRQGFRPNGIQFRILRFSLRLVAGLTIVLFPFHSFSCFFFIHFSIFGTTPTTDT